MSNVVIDLTKTVKEIITTMKTAIDNLNTDMGTLKSEILLAAHPVGSYYISDNATDPGTLFGGTWKMLDPGLTLISQGKGTDKFGSFEFVAGQTYGERMHQLTVEEMPVHGHAASVSTASLSGEYHDSLGTDLGVRSSGIISLIGSSQYRINGDNDSRWHDGFSVNASHGHTISVGNTGGNIAHENRMPYTAVNRWLRTA